MQWLPLVLASALGQGPGTTSITPADATTSSVLGYLFSYGPVGVAVVALGWLLFKGWRLISPSAEAVIREAVRAEARADLEAELARVLAEKKQAEEQRDDALRIAQTQIVPLLASFTATSGALIPLLQDQVRSREGSGRDPRRRSG